MRRKSKAKVSTDSPLTVIRGRVVLRDGDQIGIALARGGRFKPLGKFGVALPLGGRYEVHFTLVDLDRDEAGRSRWN